MIRVLQIMNGAVAGGISTVILNYYQMLDHNKIHFDCAMPDIKLGQNGRALQILGCNMLEIPLKSKHPILYWKTLSKILKEGNYDAIHVNGNATSFFPLLIAKYVNIPIRIAHVHTAMLPQNLIEKFKYFISRRITRYVATKFVACSEQSALAIFGLDVFNYSKILLLRNAIDSNKFKFSLEIRRDIRKKLNLSNKFVIGCVGNLGPEKNHTFAIKVFSEIKKQRKNAHLILVGDGELRQQLEIEVKELRLEKDVSFLGRRTDINILLQGMDIFLMPSLYEGFSLAALEAASSGLPIFFSENVHKNFNFYKECYYISLNDKPVKWAEKILHYEREVKRENSVKIIKEAGYDILDNVEKFLSLYQEK